MLTKLINRVEETFLGILCYALTVAGTKEAEQLHDECVMSQHTVEAKEEQLSTAEKMVEAAEHEVKVHTRHFKELLDHTPFVGREVFEISAPPPTFSTIDSIDTDARCRELVAWLSAAGARSLDYCNRLGLVDGSVRSAKGKLAFCKEEVKRLKREVAAAKSVVQNATRQGHLYLQMSSPEGLAVMRDLRRKYVQKRKAERAALKARKAAEKARKEAAKANADTPATPLQIAANGPT